MIAMAKEQMLNLNYVPEEIVNTDGLTHEQWLSYRRMGIGGSDVAAVMGQSPFCTRRDLFYDKVGIKPVLDEVEDNWVAKEFGHRLERLVAEIFSRKMGLEIYAVPKIFRHPLFPFMQANVDYFIRFPDGKISILECKTTNYHCQDKWANDSVPLNYEYQVRHYLSVMNIDIAYIACLFGNNENEFVIRRIDRDYDIEAQIIEEESYFWNEHVLKREVPSYTEKADLVLESIRQHFGYAEKDADVVKLNKSYAKALDNYLDLKQKKSIAEAEVKKLDEAMKQQYIPIIEELGISCTGTLQSGNAVYTVTYNPVYRTGIDKKGQERLKNRHPDIYDDYVKVSESRRFAVKKKEDAS